MVEITTTYAFTAGEVSPSFYGRQDLSKYGIGAGHLRNFLVDYKGGLLNRPGTEFIASFPKSKFPSFRMATLKWTGDDFLLLFAGGWMIVFRAGAPQVLPLSYSLTHSSGSLFPVTPALDGDGFVWVEGQADSGLRVREQNGDGTFRLLDQWGQPITFPGGVSVRRVVHVATPFAPFLPSLSFEQDKDRLIATSNGMAPRAITRSPTNVWTIGLFGTEFDLSLRVGVPTLTASSGTGNVAVGVRVAAVVNGVEQIPSNPAVIGSLVDYSTEAGWVRASWTAIPGASHYNVYRTVLHLNNEVPSGAQFGYIGQTSGTVFVDSNIVPDFTKTPIKDGRPFTAEDNDPALFLRFQQRGVFAATTGRPDSIWGSTVNTTNQFTISSPLTAADAYTHTLDATSPQPINHILPLRNGLLIFTRDNISLLRGGESKSISALTAVLEPQAYISCSPLQPLVIGLDVLFFPEAFSALHAMVYTEYTNSFATQDLAVLSNHLIPSDNPVISQAWFAEPHKVAYFIRQDGRMPTFTYDREQEVFAWSLCETDGKYLAVHSVREGLRRAPYFLVERGEGAAAWVALEREAVRVASPIEDAFFVDCGRRRVASSDSVARTFLATSETVLTLSNGTLPGAFGDYFYLDTRRFRRVGADTLLWLSGPKLVAGQNYYTAVGALSYITPQASLGNLWHLEGKTVSVLADGSYHSLPVASGTITLPSPAGKIAAGLPYRSRARTLPLFSATTNVEGIIRRVLDITVRMDKTRGLTVGKDFAKLYPLKERTSEAWGETPFSLSMQKEIFLSDSMGLEKTVSFEQAFPLPANLLNISILLEVGGR